jgi:RHS repeat-associated protein
VPTGGVGDSWPPSGGSYNASTNQYTGISGVTYDADGDLLTDTFHTYTWLADGHVASVTTGTNTTSIVYDAEGNKVEENSGSGGSLHEYVSAFGISAQMTGQTETSATASLPGGVQALFSLDLLVGFRFPDWQGSIRAESSLSRAFSESVAFAPFGERYAVKGAPFNVDSFTGKPDQITGDEYDFPARELHDGQGRWVSPDPTSGTGNKYVYADNNPLSNVDVYGLLAIVINGQETDSTDDTSSDILTQTSKSESYQATSKTAAAQISFLCGAQDCNAPGTDAMLQGMGLLAPPTTQTASSQQDALAQQAQKKTGTVQILGQSVPYTIAAMSQQESSAAMDALTSIVSATNAAQASLTPAQVAEVRAVTSIYVAANLSSDAGYSITNAKNQRTAFKNDKINAPIGTFVMNGSSFSKASVGFWASGFVHEGTHIIHGDNISAVFERRAYHEQYKALGAFHLRANEVQFIQQECGRACQ